jgi:hypothetical protein
MSGTALSSWDHQFNGNDTERTLTAIPAPALH